MRTIEDVLDCLYRWAPASIAWERDNIGLLIGAMSDPVRGILVSLDVTREVVDEATALGATLIVAHHPVIFHPLKAVRTDTPQGAVIAAALTHGIAIVAMHTNADAAAGGLNAALAARLGLSSVRALDPSRGQRRCLRFSVDVAAADMAGFIHAVEGLPDTRIDIDHGDASRLVTVSTPVWRQRELERLAAASFGVALRWQDSFTLEGAVEGFGLGAVGTLDHELSAGEFLRHVADLLGCDGLRSTPYTSETRIRTVAVCGGAGSAYIGAARAAGADAFVTADLTYHAFQDHRDALLLVDAGHYETERIFIETCASALRDGLFKTSEKSPIFQSVTNTNAMVMFK
ncbi:MAG: Nif3-like dinuclear metal center hexameric protein [Ignavibacteria bacterium]|nr:Nif3-like dinuclear metal center hexameric protein [Ignavibacteria bacterium]